VGALTGRDFLTLHDFSAEEVAGLIEAAASWKQGTTVGRPLEGRAVVLLFLKPSTRTRVAFEVAVAQLGGHPVFLAAGDSQLSRGESPSDTARVLSRYAAALVVRTGPHREVETIAEAASVPVVNALTDRVHPTEVLADLLTLRERFGRLDGLRLAYVGDGNNVAHSLLFASARSGIEVRLATPSAFPPDPGVVKAAQADGARISFFEDPVAAVRDADAIYTDVWVSMGQEAEADRRRRFLEPYRVTEVLMRHAAPHAVFLHCLPAHRGEEVEASVIDGPRSLAVDQAENRLHTAKALLAAIV
jgi:ornithine carbamoyltransferase